ncbi:MAG: 3-hydroxyacyl-CoA dehydrogenase NAD-binding domain-containing protein, partial [Alphaproteobacteria bacterium]|nr:3-hydroxyacyl-CoA dehydrogenase NAD-binding domain-containing protein [Alphaproteobacteria bacterium]
MTDGIQRAACIGGGVIGSGWAARFVLNGIDVSLCDPDPEAGPRAEAVLANAERAYSRLFGNMRPEPGLLRVARSVPEAVDGAGFVQESVPERLDLKRRVLAEIDAAAPARAVVASSTSGLLPSAMQEDMRRPERMLVGHPFNPVYLLPLVEVVAGHRTAPEAVERACAVYAGLGMKPLVLRKEIDAFIADRLQEALWREALWLVHDGVATVGEIDDAMRYSFGLRWAQMGVFQT